MRFANIAYLFSLFALTTGTCADAAIISYEFSGTVTSVFDNNFSDSQNLIFGTPVTVGDSVSGIFTYDDNAPLIGPIAVPSGSASQFTQIQPQSISVSIAGLQIGSLGDFTTVVADDVEFAPGAPLDLFSIWDGEPQGFSPFTGTEIMANGEVETGGIGLSFQDTDGTAFGSSGLPAALNLGEFETAYGRIDGSEPFPGGGAPSLYSIDFSIDSISVTAIPEPSCILPLAGLAAILCHSRRRRRRT
ncbi:hypothetical protein LOC67_17055 [Stieleria sp. JC731]|uniref:hypothetical protein n=1 Tax=Pirellulaceae TaxID=2691357 RepID=UPI001E2C4733|nr:hypothetical protein [Stieleria sp. JC731]MCC9602265.1 hypothetical protein [Stieleria sp. JC731]